MQTMKPRINVFSPSVLILLLAGTVLFLAGACGESKDRVRAGAAGGIADKPLDAYRKDLLDLAFDTASAMPLVPHIKNRSRAQEAVVAACFELDQPQRALAYIEKIENWRRGAGYADYAFYCASNGEASRVQEYLNLALQISENLDGDNAQAWRRDRIRVKVARTHAWLGRIEQAARLEAGVVDSEWGKVDAVRAMRVDSNAFEGRIEALNTALGTGNFDQMRNAMETGVQLFNRFYEDAEKRALVENSIKASWEKMPVMVRIELLMDLAGAALDHEDREKALALVDEAQLEMESGTWTPEFGVPLRAKLAGLRFRAGDEDRARSDADRALALYEAKLDTIVNIYRAGALRPLAEAYHAMGDGPAALAVYMKAVEAGVENPNSRPRAQDLSATCISMALHGIEPDADLWARMLQIFEDLGQPW
jgi:hypothetical protein